MASEAHGQASEEEVMEIAGRLRPEQREVIIEAMRPQWDGVLSGGTPSEREACESLINRGVFWYAPHPEHDWEPAFSLSPLGRRVASVLGDAKQ